MEWLKPSSDRQGDSNRDDDDNTENEAEHNKNNSKYGQWSFPCLQMERVHSVEC